MISKKFLPAALAVAVIPTVQAQNADQPAIRDTDESGLETIVVTGVAAAGGVKKLEASYNIVTANEAEIRRANPKSTADLLKISPGMWPESSGGQTGANIEIAGFPGGGDAPYYTTQLMGSPLYGMPTLSFFETSSIFRLDDTIRSTEILQGGPSVVFAGGQMGATSNFLLKTGKETPEGSVGLTYGDENLMRADAFYGFPIGESWFGSIGGFWRTSDGVRDPEFAADEGGQITATLKHEADSGQFTLYARYLDDKNQFITPIPVIQRGTSDFSEYPGFDAQTGTYYSKDIQKVFLGGYPNGGTNADLANGRGAQMFFVGANYDQDLGNGWSIVDKFLVNGGDVDTNALFSGPNPATLEDELYNIPTNLNGFELPPGSATATFVGGGAVAPDQDVIQQGWWFIHKELQNINNDFRLSKEIFDGNTLTAGVYLAYYEMDDEWSLGSLMFMANEPNTRPITVSYVNGAAQTVQFTDAQGFVNYGGFNITEKGHAFNQAVYLSDSWRLDKWLVDASVRWEKQQASNRVCNLSNVNQDGDPLTNYDNAVPVCNGTFAITDYDEDFTSWTVGANYSFTDHMSAYGRVNRRTLPRLRQRHPRQHHGQHRSHAGGEELRSRIQVPERAAVRRRQRLLARFHRPRVPADHGGRSAHRPAPVLRLRVEGRELHRRPDAGQFPFRGRGQLPGRRIHGLRRLLPVHQCRHRQWLRTHRRRAAAAPAQAALHAHAQLPFRGTVG